MTDFKTLWADALPFDAFVAASDEKHRGLWEGIHRFSRLPDWARVVPAGTRRHLLVLAEDWCGDASNTVPVLARLADEVPGFDLRILRRDEHLDLMDRYLTNGSRSIPIAIVLDEQFRELGHWGPRPRELQAWVMENRLKLSKAELYPQVRRWYARDHGITTLREVFNAAGLEAAAVA